MPELLQDASITLRPDAVTLDYRTAFSMGPVELQDPSQGLLERSWRLRVVGNNLMLSGAEGDAWGAEQVLWTVADGSLITELSLAFNQNGEAVFCAEIAGEIWILRFDATSGQFVFENKGSGRNPRMFLDSPRDTVNSDLHVFYISDVLNAVAYRTQRELYNTERVLTHTAENRYLERVRLGSDSRLQLVTVVRNIAAGQYVVEVIETKLFPILQVPEALDLAGSTVAGTLQVVLFFYDDAVPEAVASSGSVVAALLTEPVIFADNQDPESVSSEGSVVAVTLVDPRIILDDQDPEAVDMSGSVTAATLNVILIILDDQVEEAIDATASVTAAELVVP